MSALLPAVLLSGWLQATALATLPPQDAPVAPAASAPASTEATVGQSTGNETHSTGATQRAETQSSPIFLVPSLQLSGSTADTAQFKASAGISYYEGGWYYILGPRLEVSTSKGLGTLFSLSEPETSPLQLGATFSIIKSGVTNAPQNTADQRAAKIRAYDSCVEGCPATGCAFDKNASAETKVSLSPEDLCPAGQREWLRYESRSRVVRGVPPEFRLSIGALTGNQTYKYLTSTGESLVEGKEKRTTWKWGLTAAYVPTLQVFEGHLLTTEFRMQGGSTITPSSKKAQWCTDEGKVGESMAKSCTEQPLGSPSFERNLLVELDVGVVEKMQEFWRVSLGLAYLDGPFGLKEKLAIQTPIYLSFASGNAPVGYGSDYKGALRIVPMILLNPKDSDVSGVVMIELLATPTLFLGALD